MPQDLHVHLLPQLVTADQLRGGVAVVIDVLRATTTMTHALANGAKTVIPCQSIEEAHSLAAEVAGIKRSPTDEPLSAEIRANSGVILGGERHGQLIPGFDLDNTPTKYAPVVVGGKTVIFTTTNGTKALQHCRTADRILLGSFNSLHALIALLADEKRPIHLVCAGTDGEVSTDDALCAGAIATGVWAARKWPKWSGDSLRLVMDLFTCRCQPMRELLGVLRESLGGRNLIELGLDADIERSARWDLFRTVPEFNVSTGRILPATDVPAEPAAVLMAPRE